MQRLHIYCLNIKRTCVHPAVGIFQTINKLLNKVILLSVALCFFVIILLRGAQMTEIEAQLIIVYNHIVHQFTLPYLNQ